MADPGETVFVTFHFPASWSLDQINDRVKLYEETQGPLVAMNIDNDQSTFKFASKPKADRPATPAKVARQVDGKPQIPDDEELVARGRVFIAGELALCAATRSKPE